MRSPRLVLALLRALLALLGLDAPRTRASRPGFGPAAPASAPIPRELLRFAPQRPAPAPAPPPVAAPPAPPAPAPAAAATPAPAPRWRATLARTLARLAAIPSRLRARPRAAPGPAPSRDALLRIPAPPAAFSYASPPLLGRARCAVARWLVCDAPPPSRPTA